MTAKKSKRLLSIEFLDNHPEQVVLAKHLSGGWDAKAKVVAATKDHFYPLALAEDLSISDEDVKIALLDSLRCMWMQMGRMVDYCNVKRSCNLSLESLVLFGQVPVDRLRSASQIAVGKASPAENREHSVNDDTHLQQLLLDEDDEYEFEEIEAGIQLSPALAIKPD